MIVSWFVHSGLSSLRAYVSFIGDPNRFLLATTHSGGGWGGQGGQNLPLSVPCSPASRTLHRSPDSIPPSVLLPSRESTKHGPPPWTTSMDGVHKNMERVHGPPFIVGVHRPPIFTTPKNTNSKQ